MHTFQSVHCMHASHMHSYSYSYTHIIHKHFSRANVSEHVFLSSTLYLEYFLILSLSSSMFSFLFLSLFLSFWISTLYIHTYIHTCTHANIHAIHKHTRHAPTHTLSFLLALSRSLFFSLSFQSAALSHMSYYFFSLLAMSFFSSSSACAPKVETFCDPMIANVYLRHRSRSTKIE